MELPTQPQHTHIITLLFLSGVKYAFHNTNYIYHYIVMKGEKCMWYSHHIMSTAAIHLAVFSYESGEVGNNDSEATNKECFQRFCLQ